MAVIRYTRDENGVTHESKSTDGGKTFSTTGANSSNSYKPNNSAPKVTTQGAGTSKFGLSSGQNNYSGKTGKKYEVAGANGAIKVTYKDGSSRMVLPTDKDFAITQQSMKTDIEANGGSFTPNTTFTNDNGTFTAKSYTQGNNDLQYALNQAAKNSSNGTSSVEDLVKSYYNRIGKTKADGSGIITVQDVDKELERLGLSDYNSKNAKLTAGQNLLPDNEFFRIGEDSTGAPGVWGFYGGQQYLLGGDDADFVAYVNGKTGNLNNNLSYLFGNMANNPYAMKDPEFMAAYQQGQNQFNAGNGISNTGNNVTANGSITGYPAVDNVINLYNSMSNYNSAAGNPNSGTSLLEMLQGYLNSGLEANQDFLEQQRQQAQLQAEKQASDAYFNSQLAGKNMKEQLSARGMGTSGAVQSAEMGVQGDYSNNLAAINSNLATMLNSLSEQELQVLSDYYDNMTNYAYQVSNDEANRTMQEAQLALQQQQMQYDQWYQQQQLAMQQAQLDQQMREYENSLADADYNKKLQQAAYYQDLYNNGSLTDEGLIAAWSNLGLISSGYWPYGSASNANTLGQSDRINAQLQNNHQQLQNRRLAAK